MTLASVWLQSGFSLWAACLSRLLWRLLAKSARFARFSEAYSFVFGKPWARFCHDLGFSLGSVRLQSVGSLPLALAVVFPNEIGALRALFLKPTLSVLLSPGRGFTMALASVWVQSGFSLRAACLSRLLWCLLAKSARFARFSELYSFFMWQVLGAFLP